MLVAGLTANMNYYIRLRRDGEIESRLYYYATPSGFNSAYDTLDSSMFVYSNGSNYIEINGYSDGDDFYPYTYSDTYNQLTIEYIVE